MLNFVIDTMLNFVTDTMLNFVTDTMLNFVIDTMLNFDGHNVSDVMCLHTLIHTQLR